MLCNGGGSNSKSGNSGGNKYQEVVQNPYWSHSQTHTCYLTQFL